jgi:uncharacterized protein YkwD
MFKKTWFWLAVLLVGFLGFYFYIATQGVSSLPFSSSAVSYKEKAVELVKNAEEGITKTLVNQVVTEDTFRLTNEGVILYTNKNRVGNGLKPLSENIILDKIAKARAEDMFAKQYFAHVAPDGGKAETLANSFGYEYIIIGENIAMGNFDGDEDLVTSWMNSPGHRENILKSKYTEIGVAEIFGKYEGNKVWMAVQIFGTPKSACPAVDVNLRTQIEENNVKIRTIKSEMDVALAEINGLAPGTPEYFSKVAYYNNLVNNYNSLVNANKTIVEKYNAEASAYNTCLEAN